MLKLKAATHSLEGLANLQNTMFNNGLQCPDLTVHRNTLFMASGGVRCQVRGVRRRLSGKLTTSGVCFVNTPSCVRFYFTNSSYFCHIFILYIDNVCVYFSRLLPVS